MKTPVLAVRVQLPLGWDTYLLFNSDVVKFERRAYEREAESIILLIFVLWGCSNHQWVKGGVVFQKVLFRASWNCIFSSRDFSQNNKHAAFWHAVWAGYFYVLFFWAIALQIFFPCKLGLPWYTLTFTVNCHADNQFYKKNTKKPPQKTTLCRKNFFCCRLSKNYWIICCIPMTPHAILVDEITGLMISIKRSVKAKTFFKSSFFKYVSIQNIPLSGYYTTRLIEFDFLKSTSCVM